MKKRDWKERALIAEDQFDSALDDLEQAENTIPEYAIRDVFDALGVRGLSFREWRQGQPTAESGWSQLLTVTRSIAERASVKAELKDAV